MTPASYHTTPFQRATHALSESQGEHWTVIAAANDADERIPVITAVDQRSDLEFGVAFRLVDLIDRESDDSAIKQLAKLAKHRILEGLRLDALEGEHLTEGIRPAIRQAHAAGRRGSAICGAALGQRGNGAGEAA